MLPLPSHTLSLGSCCRSFTLICLSYSLTERVSLNVIFFCVIHCGCLLTNQLQVTQQVSKTANPSKHILTLSLKLW